jgi:UDP-N-acetylglucosamine 2-epimerase
MQTVWLWPNVDAGSDDISKGLRMYREKKNPEFIHFFRNFSVEDYARLIHNSACLVGNSSSALREGAFIGVPAVNIGTRQANREHGKNVIHVDYNSTEIQTAIKKQIENGRYERSTLFGDGRAGERIVEILCKTKINIQKHLHY